MEVFFEHKPFHGLTLMALYEILWLRNEVFVVGQKITEEAEVDGRDPECVHVLGRSPTGQLVATARLFMQVQPVKIGRVSVDRSMQRHRIGTQLMAYVAHIIGNEPASLSAQLYLKDWYQRLGWEVRGEVYDEAGIPHISMVRNSRG